MRASGELCSADGRPAFRKRGLARGRNFVPERLFFSVPANPHSFISPCKYSVYWLSFVAFGSRAICFSKKLREFLCEQGVVCVRAYMCIAGCIQETKFDFPRKSMFDLPLFRRTEHNFADFDVVCKSDRFHYYTAL